MNRDKYILYFDDSGNRKAMSPLSIRTDPPKSMNWFALGGVLVKDEDTEQIRETYVDFCRRWKIDYALQSSRIRGARGKFGWLSLDSNRTAFMGEVQDFLLSLPFVAVACIIDRTGYAARYGHIYHNNLWPTSKTVFSILTERAAKFADDSSRMLEIYFEESGKREDNRIIRYLKDLKQNGNPFDESLSGAYSPLTAKDYRRIILGDPHRLTKQSPHLQVADLILYPIARGAYEPDYHPHRILREAGKLIDCQLAADQVEAKGIKYSCFDH